MPGTAMLDIESCETGSIGANYQPADLVLMSDPLKWAIYSILARLSILYVSRHSWSYQKPVVPDMLE
ncbi:hypothetical protein ASPFODRAFT_54983 [Aspergillus luchuensis CBS 106.47]|uniref:Uncharacterized protein n=1 Tax=Aspergillus luchuensis (strain CBS 106.47) TaxID=1137211 RepID=A0A1M3SYL2_ASPLC|nr:hypothetical protein ASPFODRAFT_54983 [Aspergillus luchuensis CBS 106.47]